MCCEEKHSHHAMPMRHGIHHSDAHGTCGCGERKFLSKKGKIEMLEPNLPDQVGALPDRSQFLSHYFEK